jgi:biotin carboxyl carrier protein
MPGTVLKVSVAVGDVVQPQQQVVLLESMKMEMTLSAPAEARVTAVNCKEGELVQMGAVLVSLEAVEHESA